MDATPSGLLDSNAPGRPFEGAPAPNLDLVEDDKARTADDRMLGVVGGTGWRGAARLMAG